MLSHYQLTITNQDRYISTSKAELMNYQKGLLIHHQDMDFLLEELHDIEDLRFIVLTKKLNPTNSNNQSVANYYYYSIYCNSIKNDYLNILCSYKMKDEDVDICNINYVRDLSIIHSRQFYFNKLNILRDYREMC